MVGESPNAPSHPENKPRMSRTIHLDPLLLAAWALILLTGCTTLTKPWMAPEVRPVGLQPTQLGPDRQSFIVNLLVKNRNDRTLPIKAMTYRLFLEGGEIAGGSGELDRQIPAFGEERVDLEVNSSLMSLVSRLPALALTTEDLEWKITGTVAVADGLVTLPYRYSGTVAPETLMSAAMGYR